MHTCHAFIVNILDQIVVFFPCEDFPKTFLERNHLSQFMNTERNILTLVHIVTHALFIAELLAVRKSLLPVPDRGVWCVCVCVSECPQAGPLLGSSIPPHYRSCSQATAGPKPLHGKGPLSDIAGPVCFFSLWNGGILKVHPPTLHTHPGFVALCEVPGGVELTVPQ